MSQTTVPVGAAGNPSPAAPTSERTQDTRRDAKTAHGGPRLWTVEERGYATPCWIWDGATHKTQGYGQTMWNGKVTQAHIRAWIESGRERISGLQFDHLCRQRACVNPDHLEQVSQSENVRRGAHTKLTWELVREIRERYAAGGISQPALAREYGVTQGNVSSVLLGYTWKEGT